MTSQLSFALLEEKDYGRYEELNRASPHGSLFSSTSWTPYDAHRLFVLGAFKGHELVGGCVLPLAGEYMVRYVKATPWCGPIARSADEGECQKIARGMVEYCLGRFEESTLTLPPEWTDVREFIWAGMKTHMRYTYRGYGEYEKRVCVPPDWWRICRSYTSNDVWSTHTFKRGESWIELLEDWRCFYYYRSSEGTRDHTALLHAAIQEAKKAGKDFDMVGCNSPQRGLFKRGFGGRLTPYYAVTTSDASDLREDRPAHLRDVSKRPCADGDAFLPAV